MSDIVTIELVRVSVGDGSGNSHLSGFEECPNCKSDFAQPLEQDGSHFLYHEEDTHKAGEVISCSECGVNMELLEYSVNEPIKVRIIKKGE